jgi:PPOX class probable F420-dependent enzyme
VEPAELRRLVAEARVARLATVDPRGRLHLVPVCFALAGDVLYTAVDRKQKRSRRPQRLLNVEAHPEVALLVDHYEEDWRRLWWVRVRGRARVLDRGAEHERALDLLAGKYEQYRGVGRPPGPVIAVELVEWRGWAAATAR